jgi:ABC-type dipeptide/oligopeptide/nickel transport system permease component
MTRYLLRRILQAIPLLFGILVINFTLIHLAPGDPIYALAGDGGDAAYYASMRARYGLDQPLPEQLARYLVNAARGDFGYSFKYSQPVFMVVLDRIPATLLLMGTGLLLATFMGIWLGVQAGQRGDTPGGHALTIFTLIGAAMPAFWLGQMLVIVFAAQLGLFPIQGMTDVRAGYAGWRAVLDVAHHLILPAITLGLLQMALIARLTRTGVREMLTEDFVRTAYAKGLSPQATLYRHVLRNALLPVVTVIGGHIGTLLAGAVLTEIIFAWPGIGRLLYDATLARDYPLLMAILIVVSAMVIIANLLTDLIYAFLDPRIRFE